MCTTFIFRLCLSACINVWVHVYDSELCGFVLVTDYIHLIDCMYSMYVYMTVRYFSLIVRTFILATRYRHTALVAALWDHGADEENHEQMRECMFVWTMSVYECIVWKEILQMNVLKLYSNFKYAIALNGPRIWKNSQEVYTWAFLGRTL